MSHAGLKIVLVTGGREWTNLGAIERELSKLDPETTIIVQGGARGADTIAREVALEMEFFCVATYPAWWKRQGKPAGPIRNMRMLKHARPDLVLAFHENVAESKGTRNMVSIAYGASVPVETFSE